MKKIIALLLALVLLTGMVASCASESALVTATETAEVKTEEKEPAANLKTEEKKTEEKIETVETEPETINHADDFVPEETEEAPETPAETTETPSENAHMLDGKKVIFIGNSFTYYGNAVITNSRSALKQSQRMNNQGYFYQICKNNGAKVNVTNWTFGGHSLKDIFVNCAADRGCDGTDHKSYLLDRNYDYVFLQQHGLDKDTKPEEFLALIDNIIALFKEANPNVKILFLSQRTAYEHNLPWLPCLKELANRGVTIVEWGALVDDVIAGKTQIPGATLEYNQNSFIVNQSAKDGYHPNMLTGYITAQMAYCAITGESAVGQDYAFATDARIKGNFSTVAFITKYYKNGERTNMTEIFESPADMKGLQTLMDQYLAAHRYKTY